MNSNNGAKPTSSGEEPFLVSITECYVQPMIPQIAYYVEDVDENGEKTETMANFAAEPDLIVPVLGPCSSRAYNRIVWNREVLKVHNRIEIDSEHRRMWKNLSRWSIFSSQEQDTLLASIEGVLMRWRLRKLAPKEIRIAPVSHKQPCRCLICRKFFSFCSELLDDVVYCAFLESKSRGRDMLDDLKLKTDEEMEEYGELVNDQHSDAEDALKNRDDLKEFKKTWSVFDDKLKVKTITTALPYIAKNFLMSPITVDSFPLADRQHDKINCYCNRCVGVEHFQFSFIYRILLDVERKILTVFDRDRLKSFPDEVKNDLYFLESMMSDFYSLMTLEFVQT